MNETRMEIEQAMAGEKQAQVVTAIAPAKMTLAEVRAKLDGKSGKRYWKSLDELADTPAFQELMQEEFPRQASAGEWVDSVQSPRLSEGDGRELCAGGSGRLHQAAG